MNLTEFDFELPEELIATRPVSPRSSARLLVSNGEGLADRSVANLLDYLGPKDRLVLNDTKVIPARLSGIRRRSAASGGSGEAFRCAAAACRLGRRHSACDSAHARV